MGFHSAEFYRHYLRKEILLLTFEKRSHEIMRGDCDNNESEKLSLSHRQQCNRFHEQICDCNYRYPQKKSHQIEGVPQAANHITGLFALNIEMPVFQEI